MYLMYNNVMIPKKLGGEQDRFCANFAQQTQNNWKSLDFLLTSFVKSTDFDTEILKTSISR